MEKDSKRHDIEDTLSLEEIADIVEKYIHEDEDAPVYDGYDISVEDAEKERVDTEAIVKKNPSKKSVKGREVIEVKDNKEAKPVKKAKAKEKNKKSENIKKNVVRKRNYYEIKRKYKSVDMIIGIAVMAIIFSSGIGIYDELPSFLMFSKWNGISIADLGVPVLILAMCFITPTNVEFELKEDNLTFKQIAIKRIKIGIILFVVGIIINLVISRGSANFRIMGILQFIGIIYMLVSLIYIFFKRFKLKVNVIGVILIILGLVGTAGYFIISNQYGYEIDKCLASFVDSKLLAGHFVGVERFGIISTISAIFAGMLVCAGGSFICDRRSSNREKCIRLLIIGMILIIASLVIEKRCPYNVNIWSPSFVMLISGSMLIIISVMYVILDAFSFRVLDIISFPFEIFALSPIIIVVINKILVDSLFKIRVFSSVMDVNVEIDDWIILELLSQVFGEGTRTIVFILIYIMLILAASLFVCGKKDSLKERK